MGRRLSDENLEAEVNAALEEARNAPERPYIVAASYHPEPGFEFLQMTLTDGRRLLIPREELGELKDATAEQAKDVEVIMNGTAVYWPQLDDGLQLMDFLQYRWRGATEAVAA
jgi:hypothetical protein